MKSGIAVIAVPLAVTAGTGPAMAHVKWFAPFIVGAAPRPVSATLADPFFWAGIGLVLAFFAATRMLEARTPGRLATALLDRATAPLAARLDDFTRLCVAAFFVSVFAVGGIYLTPDLHSDSEAVSWVQLAIAAAVLVRPAMPVAAAGVVALWLWALREHDLFHLLDYLALGLGVAAYLLCAASDDERLRARRFAALRWAVAIALMWSSLEKFAYPEWFHPLVEEKPFLTFGLPRDAFIPMAGVAEFTLGFGLLSTPLVRRLSGLALLAIFTAAVWPFGRIDLIGHALIMAMIVTVVAAPAGASAPRAATATLGRVPAALAASLALFASGYWGGHAALYPQATAGVAATRATHAPDPDHPHASLAQDGSIRLRLAARD